MAQAKREEVRQSIIGIEASFASLPPGTQFVFTHGNNEPGQLFSQGKFHGVGVFVKLDDPGKWTICTNEDIHVAPCNYFNAVALADGTPKHFQPDSMVMPIAVPTLPALPWVS